MAKLFYALIMKYPNLGYCQGMNYIGVFLLSFCEISNAFDLYCHLIENILPEKFYEKNGTGNGLFGFQMEVYKFFIKKNYKKKII
jgi:hypothetical protein